MLRVRLFVAGGALALFGATHASFTGARGLSPSLSDRAEALRHVARADGTVAVIIQFDQLGPPVPALPPAARAARIDDIRDKASRLLADLQGWGRIENVKKFDFVPHLALHVDVPALDVLRRHPMVVDIVQDQLKAPVLKDTVPLMKVDSNAWGSGLTGSGQTVAVLDSGVDKAHPFLAGKVGAGAEACYSTTASGPNWRSSSLCPGGAESSTADGSGVNCSGISGCEHGTHVAGIAAGKDPGGLGYSGVAKDASLVAVQVFSRFDSAYYCGGAAPCILSWDSDQMSALQRVLQLKNGGRTIASVNMSLGGGRYYADCDGDPLKPHVDNLRAAGVAVVIAAGNNGYTDSISAPACISTAISVGSTCDYTGGSYCGNGIDSIAAYSNIASFVSLLAPGSAVTSSVPGGGYATWHGTSMATPQVAGAWAVRRQETPGASVTDVLAYFRSNGVTVNDTRSGGSVSGMSRVQFAAGAPPPPPPTLYTLTVSIAGAGTVTSTPAGIDCGSTCSADFAAATLVSLVAASAAGSTFSGWGGACSGTGSCSVSMDAAKSVSATFTATQSAAAPAAPSGFTAKAIARQRVQLAWSDNSSDETRFELTRTGGVSSAAVVLPANTTQYLDTGLTKGVTYTYSLKACNASGCSGAVSASATAK